MAFASGELYDYNWAGQLTTYNGNIYYGWDGVDGYLYFPSAPALIDPYAFSLSWLNITTNRGGILNWTETGFTRDNTYNTPGRISPFLEWNAASRGYWNLWVKPSVVPPYYRAFYIVSQDQKVYYYGETPWYGWDVYYGSLDDNLRWNTGAGDGSASTYMPRYSGAGLAEAEVYNYGHWNPMGPTYFGSDKAGYHDAGYALHLKRTGSNDRYWGWEMWDTALTGGTTSIVDSWYPPYYYSHGRDYYYFGAWNL